MNFSVDTVVKIQKIVQFVGFYTGISVSYLATVNYVRNIANCPTDFNFLL